MAVINKPKKEFIRDLNTDPNFRALLMDSNDDPSWVAAACAQVEVNVNDALFTNFVRVVKSSNSATADQISSTVSQISSADAAVLALSPAVRAALWSEGNVRQQSKLNLLKDAQIAKLAAFIPGLAMSNPRLAAKLIERLPESIEVGPPSASTLMSKRDVINASVQASSAFAEYLKPRRFWEKMRRVLADVIRHIPVVNIVYHALVPLQRKQKRESLVLRILRFVPFVSIVAAAISRRTNKSQAKLVDRSYVVVKTLRQASVEKAFSPELPQHSEHVAESQSESVGETSEIVSQAANVSPLQSPHLDFSKFVMADPFFANRPCPKWASQTYADLMSIEDDLPLAPYLPGSDKVRWARNLSEQHYDKYGSELDVLEVCSDPVRAYHEFIQKYYRDSATHRALLEEYLGLGSLTVNAAAAYDNFVNACEEESRKRAYEFVKEMVKRSGRASQMEADEFTRGLLSLNAAYEEVEAEKDAQYLRAEEAKAEQVAVIDDGAAEESEESAVSVISQELDPRTLAALAVNSSGAAVMSQVADARLLAELAANSSEASGISQELDPCALADLAVNSSGASVMSQVADARLLVGQAANSSEASGISQELDPRALADLAVNSSGASVMSQVADERLLAAHAASSSETSMMSEMFDADTSAAAEVSERDSQSVVSQVPATQSLARDAGSDADSVYSYGSEQFAEAKPTTPAPAAVAVRATQIPRLKQPSGVAEAAENGVDGENQHENQSTAVHDHHATMFGSGSKLGAGSGGVSSTRIPRLTNRR